MESSIIMILLTLLAAITVAIIRQRSLFGVVMLASAYSFLMASVMLVLDAVDVAMTEASVGAGVSTVVLLAALHLTGSQEYPRPRTALLPLFVAGVVGAALVWGTITLPDFGSANAVIHTHTVPRFIEASRSHAMPPNIVTAVLADFRGYDTLGETTVIFTAGIGIMLLLKGRRRSTSRHEGGGEAT